MRVVSLLLLHLFLFGTATPSDAPAQISAAEPSLWASAFVAGDGELEPGEAFQVIVAVYATSVETTTLQLDAPAPAGLTLTRARWNQAQWVRQDWPALIILDYKIGDTARAGLTELRYSVRDGAAHAASAAAWVRVHRPVVLWLPVVGRARLSLAAHRAGHTMSCHA